MCLAQAEIGEPVEFAGADALDGAQGADAVPVDVANVGARGHVHAPGRGVELGRIEDVHAAIPLQPEAQLVGVDRHDGDAEHVGILQRVAECLAEAAFIAAAIADLGEGARQFVDIRRPAEGHAIEGIVDEQGRRAAGTGARIVLAQVGRGTVGGRTTTDREPDAFVGDVVPTGVNAVNVQVVARRNVADGAVEDADAVGEVAAGNGAVVVVAEGFVHHQAGGDRDVFRRLGVQVEAETVGVHRFVLRLV